MKASSIAVVGASQGRSKFGNKCVRAYLEAGYEVWPVNLQSTRIEGLAVYKQLSDLPSRPQRISIYLQPAATYHLVPELAQYVGTQVWFNPGCANAETLAAAHEFGIDVRDGCSIVDIGFSPSRFP